VLVLAQEQEQEVLEQAEKHALVVLTMVHKHLFYDFAWFHLDNVLYVPQAVLVPAQGYVRHEEGEHVVE
jgi:hypothetical protein